MAREAKSRASPPRRRSPRGDEFEVVGRAGPVRFERAPYTPAEAREELLVVKDGDVFLCARPDGDIRPRPASGEGLYAADTRYLSELRLELGGTAPVWLSSAADQGYRATVDLTNATLLEDDELAVPQQTMSVRRELLIAGRLYHLVRLRNFRPTPIRTTLDLTLGADFADMFEVRGGARRDARGHALAPRPAGAGVALAYVGEDETFRETLVEFDPEPTGLVIGGARVTATWSVALGPAEELTMLTTVEPSQAGRRRRRRRLDTVSAGLERAHAEWREACTTIETDNELFNRVLVTSTRDLRSLIAPVPGGHGEIVTAGIPWYVAPFGRDSLLASQEALMLNPDLAKMTLRALAGLQARADDAWRDAEPGKILHELRAGELARAGLIPHTPYYGSADATPLFLVLAASHHRWTADLELMRELRPAFDRALEWIDRHGDRDGDGFVEYERRSPAGLLNQGWKDSEDALVHADGSLAKGPIALVEVQGYVYLAKVRIADVYAALGAPDVADRLRAEAGALRAAFDAAFWNADEGTYALALDGRKRQVRSVTSNPGHCLYCGIVEPHRAGALAERLMAADMFSGWGIRTLSTASPAYNPMSYHNGSVWPHDNALIASGMKRYGLHQATERIATALFEMASRTRDYRLPELYCGFDRRETASVVAYPVACIPQAWAAAAPLMLLQSLLGISARAPDGVLTINKPMLPDWLGRVVLRRMRVADSALSLAFERADGVTGFSLREQSGPIAVTMSV